MGAGRQWQEKQCVSKPWQASSRYISEAQTVENWIQLMKVTGSVVACLVGVIGENIDSVAF